MVNPLLSKASSSFEDEKLRLVCVLDMILGCRAAPGAVWIIVSSQGLGVSVIGSTIAAVGAVDEALTSWVGFGATTAGSVIDSLTGAVMGGASLVE